MITVVDGQFVEDSDMVDPPKRGIVLGNPPKSDPTYAQRKKMQARMADLARDAVVVTGHAYWGDPAYYRVRGTVGGEHGAGLGAGQPDVGLMPEAQEALYASDPRMAQYHTTPTVMRAMALGVKRAAAEGKNTCIGAYCNQLGEQPTQRLVNTPNRELNPGATSHRQNYQNIVDTTKGLPSDFIMVTPSYRNREMDINNPFGTIEGIIAYRQGKPPIVIDNPGKPAPYLDLIKQVRDRIAQEK